MHTIRPLSSTAQTGPGLLYMTPPGQVHRLSLDADRSMLARVTRVAERHGLPVDRRARGRAARRSPTSRSAASRPSLFLVAARSRSRCCSRARPGVGKTELAKALAARAGRPADPPAVLRGPRRRARRLRVELRAPAAAHPRRAGGRGRRAGALRPRVPHPPPAARGDRLRGAGRAAHRRDRPRRRRVRGLPARGALGLPDHDPGDRHDRRARAARRSSSPPTAPASCTTRSSAAACSTGSRTRRSSARSRSCACACPACPSGWPREAAAFVAGLRDARPGQGAGRGRDDRLDAGARRARLRGARRDRRRADARRGAEVLRGLRPRPRRRGRRAARRGARAAAAATA